jgi:autotransporter-associated beta strand protein
MKNDLTKRTVVCLSAAMLAVAVGATDGTWASASAGGSWFTAANWTGGAIPGDGGTAYFNFTSQSGVITISGGNGATTLGGLDLYLSLPANSNMESYFEGILFNFVSPANINLRNGIIVFRANTVSNDCGLVVSGPGRMVFQSPQKILGRFTISNGWARVVADAVFGPAPASLVPDAITLDNGILQNGGTTELAATRGVTVTENGGSFAAGYNQAYLKINGPVTGPGEVRIAMENCPVHFNNPANDWDGDMVVGTAAFGDIAYTGFKFVCGADEVVPHGAGKGRLRLELGTSLSEARARFDLAGHVETVNAITSETRGEVVSSVAGGVLKLASDADSAFDGRLVAGATMEKYGSGKLSVGGVRNANSGTFVHREGALEFVPGSVAADGHIVLADGTAKVVSGTAGGVYDGCLEIGHNATIDVAADADFVFAGRLVAPAGTSPTVVFNMEGGNPLVIGSTVSQRSAFIDVDLSCAAGVVVTNYVWTKKALPANVVISPGTTLTVDYAGALAQDVTLSSTDLRVAAEGIGNGTITVPTGRSVLFTTQSEAGGEFVDPVTGERTFANNVVLQGGHLVFEGKGTNHFNGAVSGWGDIFLNDSGTVVLADGSGLGSGCTVRIYNGTLCVPETGSLGAANVRITGGVLANVAGQNLTLENNMAANGGGVRVDGADALMTISGAIAGENPISLWGDGTLRLSGTGANTHFMHVRGGVLRLAKENAIEHLIGCEPGCRVVVEAEGAFPSHCQTALRGGVLDMNGHSSSMASFKTAGVGSIVTNSSSSPTVLIVAGDSSVVQTAPVAHSVTFADGEGPLKVVFADSATNDLSNATLANPSGGVVVSNGMVRFVGTAAVRASLLRFLPTKSRPGIGGAPDYAGSGFQISEFRLLLNGSAVAWPEDAVAWARYPTNQAGNESAPKVIDGKTSTKWYASSTSNPLIIDCGETVEFDSYQFATGGDAKGRDPISWTFEIGTVSGSTTNWIEVDSQTDVSNLVPVARQTYTGAFPIAVPEPYSAFDTSYAISVCANGTLLFDFCGQTFNALSGNGTLLGVNGSVFTIAEGSTFCGTVSSAETVKLSFSGATIPGMTAAAGTTIVNDGAAGTLTFTAPGTSLNQGVYADGVSALGIDVGAGARLVMDGEDAAYTGSTRVRSEGNLVVANGLRFARHFRFFPLKGTGGQTRVNIQFSELQLMFNGERLPWPDGTTAVSRNDNSGKGEGAAQLIDGDVSTKCYWGGEVFPVLISVPEVVAFGGYRWYTGNDSMNARNPVSWTFEYSLDGENWILLDEQTDRETTSQTKALAYTFTAPAAATEARTALSDASSVALDAGGTCMVYRAEETIGALSGGGVVDLVDGELRVNASADASFAGDVVGTGVFVKCGSGIQTLSGELSFAGELVVEAGTLNLADATLSGVTNIILKGGVLVGTASTTGDLKVTCQGGAYAANIAVGGCLELAPSFTLGLSGEPPFSQTAFTYGSLAAGSAEVFSAAVVSGLDKPSAWQVNHTVASGRLAYSVQRLAMVIIFK